jgi:3-(3-hydroxy-phenyl)propionate hydroxylase
LFGQGRKGADWVWNGRGVEILIDRVIIVGAGPVGLVTAMLLAEHDIPVLLFEAEGGISDDLRASTFHPPTLDMLAPFGISAPLIEQGLICPHWQIRMHPGGEKAVFDLSVIADHTGHPYRLQCEQAKLARILADRLTGSDLVDIRFNCPVVELQQEDDRAAVTVDHGGERETYQGRFVIGADGAGSFVRQALDLPFEGMTYPETTVLVSTTYPFEEHIEGLSNVNYCWSPEGNFSLLRLKDFWRCSLYYDPDLTFKEAVEESRVQAQLNEIYPNPTAYEIVDRRPYRVHQRLVTNFRRGRVLLVGDAAHLSSPSGGMGLNGGIHDAFNLADKLALVWLGADQALLDQYTRQRRPVVESAILQQADRNRKRMTEKDPAARARSLAEMQKIAANPALAREHLLKSSMIHGLRQAGVIL